MIEPVYANNKDAANQSVHQPSLISVFGVCCHDNIIQLLYPKFQDPS